MVSISIGIPMKFNQRALKIFGLPNSKQFGKWRVSFRSLFSWIRYPELGDQKDKQQISRRITSVLVGTHETQENSLKIHLQFHWSHPRCSRVSKVIGKFWDLKSICLSKQIGEVICDTSPSLLIRWPFWLSNSKFLSHLLLSSTL